MNPPEAGDMHRLRAAQGWIELGLPAEATLELDQLSSAGKCHAMTLELRWAIEAEAGAWDRALKQAELQVAANPTLVSGWIHRAYSLRRVEGGGLEAALAALLPAATLFPEESMVAYNLACYLVRLNRVEEGWRWYVEAEKRGDSATVRKLALDDPDLREIWPRISAAGGR